MPPKRSKADPVLEAPAEDVQVMVTEEHTLAQALRLAESIYAHVAGGRRDAISWDTIGALNHMEASTAKRLWRYVAYHWKGPPGRKRSAVRYEDVDMDGDSDFEGSLTHGIPVSRKMKKGRVGTRRTPSTFPAMAKAYVLFSREHWDKVKADNPGIAFGDIAKAIGQKWRDLSAADRQLWTDMALSANSGKIPSGAPEEAGTTAVKEEEPRELEGTAAAEEHMADQPAAE